ncbi:MAG TPA: hypothetical protein VGS20_17170 [Candidatus Acidoferrales bacterium]|nr:hypothetical protein [Candidatus Acidoferrales bacterium]
MLAALALTVASVFLFATIAAVVIHHHQSAASEATCPICHLNHQVAVRAVAARALPLPQLRGGRLFLRETFRRSSPPYSLVPARAPPAA